MTDLPPLRATIRDPMRYYIDRQGVQRRIYGNKIPVTKDPAWPAAALPVLELVAKSPLSIDAVIKWCVSLGDHDYEARNRLAWLCVNDLVRYVDAKKVWRATRKGRTWLRKHAKT